MLFLVLDPLILMLTMYLVARHEADLNFLKIFVLCLVLSILVQSGALFIGPLSLLIYVALLPSGLVRFCYLRWKIAFWVTGIFLVAKIGAMIGLILLLSK